MAFNIGGLVRSAFNPMTAIQLAMGPAGWGSLALRTVGAQIPMNAIQQLGQRVGVPQGLIDVAQATFAREAGLPGLSLQNRYEAATRLAQDYGLNPAQQGEIFRAADKGLDAVNRILERMARKAAEEEGESASTQGSGSVLMRIARAMGEVMDDKMNAMAAKGDQLGRLGNDGALTKEGNFNAKGQSQYGKLTSEMQALGQELSMVSQAVANTLKAVGEAGSTIARK